MNPNVAEVRLLVETIGPLFAGRQPEIVSSALADLLATLLAGFQGEDVDVLRERLLAHYIKVVRQLIPINEKELAQRRHCH
jgi:hypothetical protein